MIKRCGKFFIIIVALLFIVALNTTLVRADPRWTRFGGGDNQWAINYFAVCEDGIMLGMARTADANNVPVTATDSGAAEILNSTLSLEPTTVPITVEGYPHIYNFISYNRFYWTSAQTVGESIDLVVDAEGQTQFENFTIQDCTLADAYMNADLLQGPYGAGKLIDPVDVAVASNGDFYVLESGFIDAIGVQLFRVQKFDASNNFLMEWGSDGSEPGQFSSPGGIAVDSAGNVYIADSGNNRVQKFDSNGIYISSLTDGGNLGFPQDVALDADDNIYVTDSNDGIEKFDPAFTKLTATPIGDTQLNAGRAVAVDSTGNIFAIDGSSGGVYKYNSAGTLIATFDFAVTGVNFSFPNGIDVDATDNVYVSDSNNNRVVKLTNAGAFVIEFGPGGYFDNPLGIDIGTDGRLYEADNGRNRIQIVTNMEPTGIISLGEWSREAGHFFLPHDVAYEAFSNTILVIDSGNQRVQQFDLQGNFMWEWGSQGNANGQFQFPTGIAADGLGNIYVADSGNNRIQVFDTTGAFIAAWVTDESSVALFSNPADVAADNQGNVYVADTGNNRIRKLNTSGVVQLSWGVFGTGDGQFDAPTDVAVDIAGNIYVSDSNNRRVQKFDSAGTYLDQWQLSGIITATAIPDGIATDAFGNIYVSDTENLRVQKFSNTGDLIAVIGYPMNFGKELEIPRGVTVDAEGRVYVADTSNTPGNDRIMIYEQLNQPAAIDDSYTVGFNTPLTVAAPGILSNDVSSFFGDVITLTVITPPTHGTLSAVTSGGFTYTPNETYVGLDKFIYEVSANGSAARNRGEVLLAVTNPQPTTLPDSYETPYETALTVAAASGVLANDSDLNGDTLTAVVVTGPAHGTLALQANGGFTYTPAASYAGLDSFTYYATDGTTNTAATTVTISIDYELSEGPSALEISGSLNVGVIRPTFAWGHKTDESQEFVAGQWYNVVVEDENGNEVLNIWLPAEQICRGNGCSYTPDADDLPLGLLNGQYSWTVQAWADDVFSETIAGDEFEVTVPVPAIPSGFTVTANQGRPSIILPNDMSVTWLFVSIGDSTHSYTYDAWHEKDWSLCDVTNCTIHLDAYPPNGTYQVAVVAWGPAGYAQDGDNFWSESVTLAIDFNAPAAPTSLTVTDVSSGRPTFAWSAPAAGIWYQVWVGTSDFSETYFVDWFGALESGCAQPGDVCKVVPDVVLDNNQEYVWYIQSWGVNGFSEWAEAETFTVNTTSTGTPTLTAPTGTVSTSAPMFTWSHLPEASWYYLWVGASEDETIIGNWYPVEVLNCRDDNTCSIVVPDVYLPSGDYSWYVEAYSPAGLGSPTDIQFFTVKL